MSESEEPLNARLVIDLTALRRGIVGGCVVILPVSLVLTVADSHHSIGGGWSFLAFVAILFGYATAGYGAARTRPETPLSHGMLAGLGAFLVWMIVRLVVPIASRGDLHLGVVSVVTETLFAVALGAAGGLLAARRGPTAVEPD